MNKKFNKNAKVEQLTTMFSSLGEEKGLIVKDPLDRDDVTRALGIWVETFVGILVCAEAKHNDHTSQNEPGKWVSLFNITDICTHESFCINLIPQMKLTIEIAHDKNKIKIFSTKFWCNQSPHYFLCWPVFLFLAQISIKLSYLYFNR